MTTKDARMEFSMTMGQPQKARDDDRGEGEEFRILILADFSGRDSRGIGAGGIVGRRPVRVDLDNFDATLARCGTEIHVPIGGPNGKMLPIAIGSMDDFHPDQLFNSVPIFSPLKALHAQLADPAAQAQAAAQVKALLGLSDTPPAATPTPADPAANPFASLLGQPPAAAEAPRRTAADQFISSIVSDYAVAGTDPEIAKLRQFVEQALGAGMKAILHQKAFQAVEAAWRGVQFLLANLNTDEALKIYVLDVSKAELAADLANGPLESTGFYKLMVEQTIKTPGGVPWALLVADYTFDQSESDVRMLAQLATVCADGRAPLLAAGAPAVVGCGAFDLQSDADRWSTPAGAELWNRFRELPQTQYLGLTAPRLLLRQPYGPTSDQTDQFNFDEMAATPAHEDYLWGNAAFAAAYVLGNDFLEDGWAFSPGQILEVNDLPNHVYEADGERVTKPCAEAYLSERAAEKIRGQGLIPVLSVKGRNAVRLVGLASLANGEKPLAGRWGV